MIRIGKPYLETGVTHTRLCADVVRNEEKKTLWFEVENRFAEYLLVERSDAFVIGLLLHAIQYGHDIVAEAPMTRRIYEQLTDQFLPCFNKMHGEFKKCRGHKVTITAPLDDEVAARGDSVGTGISCGVDSLHVFAAHPEVTHACIWNLHGVTNDETKEIRELGWKNLVAQAERFCAETNHTLIVGNTNFDRGCFPELQFDGSTTYGNLFAVHCLQKLWRKYYVASTYDIGDFSLSMSVFSDSTHHEYLLFPFVSGDHFSVRMDAPAQTRVDKVKDLISYAPAKKFLNVCWSIHPDHRNGTYDCPKCMRTILNLWAWEALDEFRDVFDIDYVKAHPEDFLAELYRGYIQKNPYATEMREHFGKKHIPLITKIKAARIVVKKIILKILRLGKTNHRFIAH